LQRIILLTGYGLNSDLFSLKGLTGVSGFGQNLILRNALLLIIYTKKAIDFLILLLIIYYQRLRFKINLYFNVMYRFFLVVFISILFGNCTKEIDFLLDNKTEGLAVSSKFNSQGFSLFLSSTTGILEGEYPVIPELKVTLFENDSAIYNSVIDTNHLFIPYFAKTGISYKLLIEDTFGNVLAGKATMPQKVFLGKCTMKMTEDKCVNDIQCIQ
jgi:hypothetical protein